VEQLGRYQLDRKLAQGGMAEVFLARTLSSSGEEMTCVVKRMLPVLSEDITFVEMFLDEARVAVQLAHSGIAQIFDFGHERDTYYLAMEYVPGANLKAVLESRAKAGRPVPVAVAARLTSRVAQALDYAHHATDTSGRPLSIIHRDVSPANVMVGTSGEVKLIDFGIAKAASDSHRTAGGMLKGKYAYMAPEQLRQQPVDRRADIYALGLVFYELLAGRSAVDPNENLNQLIVNAERREYAPIERWRPQTPPPLKAVLSRALALEPADRFQTAGELSSALEQWLTTVSPVKPSELAALLDDPTHVSTEPTGQHAVRRLEEEVTKTPSPGREAREREQAAREADREETWRDEQLREPPHRPTEVPRPKELDRSRLPSALNPTAAERRVAPTGVVDPSLLPTPIVGTPPVARRAVDEHDTSLVPTEPERVGPDIDAVMKMTSEAVGRGTREAPTPAWAARRWPWVVLIAVLSAVALLLLLQLQGLKL
jgi:serine/threonine-protein kinase